MLVAKDHEPSNGIVCEPLYTTESYHNKLDSNELFWESNLSSYPATVHSGFQTGYRNSIDKALKQSGYKPRIKSLP